MRKGLGHRHILLGVLLPWYNTFRRQFDWVIHPQGKAGNIHLNAAFRQPLPWHLACYWHTPTLKSMSSEVNIDHQVVVLQPARNKASESSMRLYIDLPAGNSALQDYYGKVLQSTKDLKTSACTAAGKPHPLLRSLMAQLPEEVQSRFYGCGLPVPLGIQGLRLLDLGSGSGRDCYLSAALVGEAGSVTGIDMTEEQLQVSWLCHNVCQCWTRRRCAYKWT